MAIDFISQSSFESEDGTQPAPLSLAEDKLGHENLAELILQAAVNLPPGSVIAVQGSWGEGKTDVIARIANISYKQDNRLPDEIIPKAFWLNPWQYGTPDLLSPLVIKLLDRIPPQKSDTAEALWIAAQTVIRAGIGFGLKATSTVVPGMELMEMGADYADQLLKGLFKAIDQNNEDFKSLIPDGDPVAEMGKRFRELISKLISEYPEAGNARILVCIDDLDRCLPDRQVAILEAIRFLTSAGAQATFLIAIDPTLARQALITHYKSENFNPDLYLDKIFHLRLPLPALSSKSVSQLVEGHLEGSTLSGQSKLKDNLSMLLNNAGSELIVSSAEKAFQVPSLRNPRVIERVFTRLFLLSRAVNNQSLARNGSEITLLLSWLGLIERWPVIRMNFQDAGEEYILRFNNICSLLLEKPESGGEEIKEAVLAQIPREDADLKQIFGSFENKEEVARYFYKVDNSLRKFGL